MFDRRRERYSRRMTVRPLAHFFLVAAGLTIALLASLFISGGIRVRGVMIACEILLGAGVLIPWMQRRDGK